MFTVALTCILLVLMTIALHAEVLASINVAARSANLVSRSKLLAAMLSAFVAHLIEIFLYGVALFGLAKYGHVGGLKGFAAPTLGSCLYFSAETFTSLGFGDITPDGPLRFMAGLEALNGLLLIGWSACQMHVLLERVGRTT
jgi:hypothetical protein